MDLLNLSQLGARQRAAGKIVDFGVYLPWITATGGFEVFVKLIHEKDQFLQNVKTLSFPLSHTSTDPVYGAYWDGSVDISNAAPPGYSKMWGQPGRYVYRFEVHRKQTNTVVDWIIDPFAREHGVGKMSAFTLDYQEYAWSVNEDIWKTPQLRDLVVYELHLGEFANGIDGAVSRLDYLADLGVNCIEVMPVSNIVETVNWGFQPIGFFGVDDRFGNRAKMQEFIDAAHNLGLAVILDVVFGHTGKNFPYSYLYRSLGFGKNPFHWSCFGENFGFGERTNWCEKYVEDYFFTVSHHWLECYHIDGFRYDCVPEIWDPILMRGYHRLAYNTYKEAQDKIQKGEWLRFKGSNGEVSLIQCAEQLMAPKEAIRDTYGNSTWCAWVSDGANAVAKSGGRCREAINGLGLNLGLYDFPRQCTMNGDTRSKSVFQYIESHDSSRFINLFGENRTNEEDLADTDFHIYPAGDRGKWFKTQPYLIALLLADGIPMLWQGQELCDNNSLPWNGEGRVGFLRPVHWNYFYDIPGSSTLWLVRKLLAMRKQGVQFRHGDYSFYGDSYGYSTCGLLLYRRYIDNIDTVVAVNFTNDDIETSFVFCNSGIYRDDIHNGQHDLCGVVAGQPYDITIPGNYGRVWTNP